jgi:hypothetical protein
MPRRRSSILSPSLIEECQSLRLLTHHKHDSLESTMSQPTHEAVQLGRAPSTRYVYLPCPITKIHRFDPYCVQVILLAVTDSRECQARCQGQITEVISRRKSTLSLFSTLHIAGGKDKRMRRRVQMRILFILLSHTLYAYIKP